MGYVEMSGMSGRNRIGGIVGIGPPRVLGGKKVGFKHNGVWTGRFVGGRRKEEGVVGLGWTGGFMCGLRFRVDGWMGMCGGYESWKDRRRGLSIF